MSVQLPLIPIHEDQTNLIRAVFSNACPQQQRVALEKKYATLLQQTNRFSRKLVSYQGNKGEMIHGWIQYKADQFAGVITSLPYCNRYDYTRIYALEIAYLQGGKDLRELRQDQLSCTVENRSKLNLLQKYYQSLGQQNRYDEILSVIQNNPVFVEINQALRLRWQRGDMNNKGVLTMVEQYFAELTFVFAELFRVCRSGAWVAFVNDNVRYGGEVIPVDLLSTSLAEDLGFEPLKVYVLPQRKKNSSQQMEKFGREALRKSITVWKKP